MATLQRMTKMNISNENEIKKCAFENMVKKRIGLKLQYPLYFNVVFAGKFHFQRMHFPWELSFGGHPYILELVEHGNGDR